MRKVINMQGRVSQEYLDQFFNHPKPFPKPYKILNRIEEVYNIIEERAFVKIKVERESIIEEYNNLPWWKKIGKGRPEVPTYPRLNYTESFDPIEYFSSQSQAFKEYEKQLKNLQIVVDVIKLASLSKSQVWCTAYEMRALEQVYKNMDDYIYLDDAVECSLQKYL